MSYGATSPRRERWLTPPTILTLLRLALAPAFVLAPDDVWRGVVLLTASLTEFLDGWLARRTGRTSRMGELLDPVADRVFVLAALLTFIRLGRLGLGGLLLLLVRDLFTALAAGIARLLRLPLRLRARPAGKVVTALQLLALVVLLVWPARVDPLLIVTALAGVVAIVDYTAAARRQLRHAGGSGSMAAGADGRLE